MKHKNMTFETIVNVDLPYEELVELIREKYHLGNSSIIKVVISDPKPQKPQNKLIQQLITEVDKILYKPTGIPLDKTDAIQTLIDRSLNLSLTGAENPRPLGRGMNATHRK